MKSKIRINLENQCILVTGGAGNGVGAGVCQVLAKCGTHLVINDLSQKEAKKAAALYPKALGIAADISQPLEVEKLFKKATKQIGPITGLVNNAGVGLCQMIHQTTEEEFDRVYQTNIRGLWLCSRMFVKQLLSNKMPGNIVNISSVHAHSTQSGYSVYASAKSAVSGLTRGLAVELGKEKIRVNAVAPGLVRAEQNEALLLNLTDDPKGWLESHAEHQQALNHEITNDDCGNAVAFLLSDLSRSITGQTLYVDNGMTCMLYNRDFVEKN